MRRILLMQENLALIHLQLTANCNLRCPFCGQWGEHGFRLGTEIVDLDKEVWIKFIYELKAYCVKRQYKELPQLILWGGEPLLHPEFDRIAEHAFKAGFTSAIVTNGTILDEHAESINKYISTVYISIDGPEKDHDFYRNHQGLFKTVERNLKLLDTDKVFVSALFTITPSNYKSMTYLPFHLPEEVKRVIIQNLMYAEAELTERYEKWALEKFGIKAEHAASWKSGSPGDYVKELPALIEVLQENIKNKIYPVDTVLYPLELNPENIHEWYFSKDGVKPLFNSAGHCQSPFRHISVSAEGDVYSCIDYDDIKYGNISKDSFEEIMQSELLKIFRQEVEAGKNPFCRRCPWRYNDSYKIDSK